LEESVRIVLNVLLVAAVMIGLTTVAMSQGSVQPIRSTSPTPIQATCSAPANATWPIPSIWNVLSIIIACASLYLVRKGHRTSEKSLNAKVVWDAVELLEGKDGETRKNRHLLEKLVKDAAAEGKEFNILEAAQGDQEKLDELARTYDMAGHLVKHGIIPPAILFDFYSRPIALAWKYIGLMVEKKRNDSTLPQPGHMKQFEILAAGAALYRKKKNPAEPPFQIASGVEAAWKKWARKT
jgi:hypothetical protein